MTEKEKLLEYIKKPVLTTAKNSMGCDENWYNSYFAIKETFSIEEINSWFLGLSRKLYNI